jgi:hypothetical protein
MPPMNPIEFVRRLTTGQLVRCGNRVQLEDADGVIQTPLTDTQLRASPVPVSGTLEVASSVAPVAAADVHAPAANTAAVVTYEAVAALHHVISGIAWSYAGSGTLTGGNLKVEDGAGTTVFSIDITSLGAGFIPFIPPKRGTVNTAMVVTLAAGGADVTGKVSVLGHWTEA